MKKAYSREFEMWNQVYKEYTPVDLRRLNLTVEPMFDEALRLFAEKTSKILDFGCGTGDISFQYLQVQPTHSVLGIDKSDVGIRFATETAKMSGYTTASFINGGLDVLRNLASDSYDGIIISNVLDVMPKAVSLAVMDELMRILTPGGYWFIKMNPYYSAEELECFGYEKTGSNIYEEDHVMRLRQATTQYWKNRLSHLGKEVLYLEFEYPWQEGMNRLFVYETADPAATEKDDSV